MESLQIGDQVVFNETDAAKIRKMQEEYDSWENFMEELKNGPGRLCEINSTTGFVESLSGEIYAINRKLLTKFKRCTSFKRGDRVEIIRSEKLLKQYLGVWGDIPANITEILGKTVEIVQIFVDGDYGVKYNDKIFTIKEKCIAKKISTQEHSISDSDPGFRNMKNFMLYNDIINNEFFRVSVLADEIDLNTRILEYYPLILACATGHQNIIEILLENKADVNVKDDTGSTALHIAVRKNLFKICDLLLQYGADVNSLDNDKDTPLMCAVNLGYADIVKLLAENTKANLSVGNLMDQTALHLAINKMNIECVEILLSIGGCPKFVRKTQDLPFHIAVIKENTRILELFLKMFGDSIINIQAADKTAVYYAVKRNITKALKILIEHKADINLQNSILQTPLHIAVTKKHMDCVKMLVENQAELELKDKNGYTPLHLAVFLHNSDLLNLKKLKQKQQSLTAIIPSLNISTFEDIIIYLAKAGARIDMIKEDGQKPSDSCMDESLKKKLLAIRDERNSKKAAEIPTIFVQSVPARKSVAEEINKLRQTIKQMRNEEMCKMCNERRRTTVFGCGHTACDICGNDLSECQMCQFVITLKIKII